MRDAGQEQTKDASIKWVKGSAEATGLEDDSVDLVCMASSFHWPDFDRAVAEFARIVRPGGYFMALWNTRRIESNPLFLEIEAKLGELGPELERVSSGRSKFCDGLFERLKARPEFSDVVYVEGRHTEM